MEQKDRLLTLKEASEWASVYIGKNVTSSNIAYLVHYGRVRKIRDNGSTQIALNDLKEYYKSFNGAYSERIFHLKDNKVVKDLISIKTIMTLKQKSMTNNNSHNFIPKHGGYKKLLSYQRAEIIYDGTIYFVNRFYRKPDRTIDQMVQAARSGKQNIAEGCMASATSKEMEIKLVNVARASLEELKIDYEDFWDIRQK